MMRANMSKEMSSPPGKKGKKKPKPAKMPPWLDKKKAGK